MAQLGKTVFFTVLGLASALGAVGYFQTRATWRTATESELRRVIDPALLVRSKSDPAARDRYDRMVEIVSAMKSPAGYGMPKKREILSAFLQNEKSRIEALERILAEGPMERPLPSWNPDSFVPSARITIAVKALAWAGTAEAAAGRTESAARLFRLGLLLAFCLDGHHVNTIDMVMQGAHANEVFRALYPLLSKFDEHELQAIAQAIPPAKLIDEDYRRAVRLEFQGLILPALADPRAWNQKATGDPRAPINTDDLPGSYDAFETARLMSDALVANMANAGTRRPYLNDVYGPRARFLFLTLPTDHSAGAKGLWVPIRKVQYRIQMARTANSFARQNFFPTLENSYAFAESSLRGRTIREAIHTLVALHRYRLRYQTVAPSLDHLVQEKLLTAPPVDYMGRGLINYNAVRKRLWSVGENGKDDGGTDPKLYNLKAPDYIWATP